MSLKKTLYFIAVLPPEEIRSKITEIKNEIAAEFGPRHALRLMPHVTLIPPFPFPEKDENDLKSLAGQVKTERFSIICSGSDHFSDKTLYINVKKSDELVHLQNSLQETLLHQNVISQKLDERPFRPHITLANRDMNPDTFFKLWKDFSERNIYLDFMVKQYVLFKHTGSPWDIIHEYLLD